MSNFVAGIIEFIMLIVLEGLDGAGKSTQVKLLKDYIAASGRKLEYMHFPRYDSSVYGNLIGKFLSGEFGSNEQVHPQLVALLFALDRQDASKIIRKWLEEGSCVLLDRYVYSNIAYQCSKIGDAAKRRELMDWIFRLEYEIYAIPRPDINLFLDVPIDFVESSLKSNRSGNDRDYLHGHADIHEESLEFQKNVREIYLEQCRRDPDFIKIDCSNEYGAMASPEVIFNRIREHIQ